MKITLALFTLFLIPSAASGQGESRFSLSLQTGLMPDFQLTGEAPATGSTAYGIELAFDDRDYSRMRYAFSYSRGYHSTVSYAAGLSAGVVIPFTGRLSLEPGIEVANFRMKDRQCRTSFRTILNALFDAYDSCEDDSHISYRPYLATEWKLSEPLSILFRTDYRFMMSHTWQTTGSEKTSSPDGGQVEREYRESERRFYRAGPGFTAAIRFRF